MTGLYYTVIHTVAQFIMILYHVKVKKRKAVTVFLGIDIFITVISTLSDITGY